MAFYALLLILVAPSARSADAELEAKLNAKRPIASMDSPWMEELTWMEIRDKIAAGVTTVIVPTGGVEENGPYLATGKHNLILQATCPVIAASLGDTLCAPIVKFVPEGTIVPPSGAMRFPGTISLREDTFVALLEDIANSLKQHGFQHIVLIGDSGGNQSGMQRAAENLNKQWSSEEARALFIRAYYDPGWEATEEFTRRELGVDQSRDDGYHDDIWVTAMMSVADPASIRYEQRQASGLDSINGVSISPIRDTRSLGQKMIKFRAELTADAIRAALKP